MAYLVTSSFSVLLLGCMLLDQAFSYSAMISLAFVGIIMLFHVFYEGNLFLLLPRQSFPQTDVTKMFQCDTQNTHFRVKYKCSSREKRINKHIVEQRETLRSLLSSTSTKEERRIAFPDLLDTIFSYIKFKKQLHSFASQL